MGRIAHVILCSIWVVIAGFIFLPVLSGEFIFDDVSLLAEHFKFAKIESIWDCFEFVHQPTKPVYNFTLAFGQWVGDGSTWGHRSINFVIHGMNSILLAIFLLKIAARLRYDALWAYSTAILFCFLPIQAEVIYISQFRGDLLMLFFILAALCFLSFGGRFSWIACCACVLGAQLSKEVGVLVAPLTLFAAQKYFFEAKGAGIKWGLTFVTLVSTIYIVAGYLTDMGGWYFSYKGNVGWTNTGAELYVEGAFRSLVEGVWKTLHGQGMTFVRLLTRGGFAKGVGLWGSMAGIVFVLVLCVSIWIRFTGSRFFLAGFALPTLLYSLIPNVNVGADHYYYAGSPWLLALILGGFGRLLVRYSRLPQVLFAGSCLFYLVINLAGLRTELNLMSQPLAYYKDKLELNPDSRIPYVGYAGVLLTQAPLKPENYEEAKRVLFDGIRKFGRSGLAIRVENHLYSLTRDIDSMRWLNRLVIEHKVEMEPIEMAKFHAVRGVVEGQLGYCKESIHSFETALSHFRLSPTINDLLNRVKNAEGTHLPFCGLDSTKTNSCG